MMAKTQTTSKEEKMTKKKCGIIMPIASNSDYPKDHWTDVLGILVEAIETTEFEPRLVSDDVAIGLIHDRIVTNIYNDDVIVCDVSSKNPNVMFELGLRLAFDKPTIIIKDEKTGYSFDTGVIEHISYPSSLRFSQIVAFKEDLIKKINATYKKSKNEPNYSPFLKSFGKTIVPATINQTEIPEGKFILEQLEILRHEIRAIRYDNNESLNLSRNSFKIKENSKRNIIDSVLNKININEAKFDDKNLHNMLRNELMHNGIDISSDELQLYLNGYMDRKYLKKK